MKFFYTACICFALVASISAVAIGAGQLSPSWGSHGVRPVIAPIVAAPSRARADAVAGAHAASLNPGTYGTLVVPSYGTDGSDYVSNRGYVGRIAAVGPLGLGVGHGVGLGSGLGVGHGVGLGSGLGVVRGAGLGLGLGNIGKRGSWDSWGSDIIH